MKLVKSIILLLCLPGLIWCNPSHSHPVETCGNRFFNESPWELLQYENLNYDKIIDFVEAFEEGEFEDAPDWQIEEMFDFICFLVRMGTPEDELEEIDAEIEELKYSDDISFSSCFKPLKIVPAVCYAEKDLKFQLCKNWLIKKGKRAWKWTKNHKKRVLIGTAVAAVATTVVILTAGTGTAAVAAPLAAGAAIGGGGNAKFRDEAEENQKGRTFEPVEAEQMREISYEKTNELKEALLREGDLSKELAKIEACKTAHAMIKDAEKLHELLSPTPKIARNDLKFEELHDRSDQAFADQPFPKKPDPSLNKLWGDLGKDLAFCFLPVPGGQFTKLPKLVKTSRAIVKAARAAGIVRSAVVSGAVVNALQEAGNVSVYHSFNRVTGETNYVGISKDVARRAMEHARGKGIKIKEIEGLENLTRSDARAVEQVLIEINGLEKNGGSLLNRINSIAKTNPKYAESLVRGAEILKDIKAL